MTEDDIPDPLMHQLEQERMRLELAVLRKVYDAGLTDEAHFFAVALGLSREFTQEIKDAPHSRDD